MANICLTYTWSKHEALSVEIYAEESFPDALNQAANEAVRALMATLTAVNTQGDGDADS